MPSKVQLYAQMSDCGYFHLTDTPFVCIPARAELPAFGMRCWNGSAETGNKRSALQNRITPLLIWMASNGIWELSYPLRRLQHRLAIPIILEIASPQDGD